MKILYVSQYYPPEIGAPAARVSELARAWAALGHEVSVLTGFPNHPDGKIPPEYRRYWRRLWMRDDCDGVRVYRTWLLPLPNRRSWERMLNYSSFCVSAVLRGIMMPRPDVLIATSPQLLVGVAGMVVAKVKRGPFVFEVRDLWPESLEAVGVSHRGSKLYRIIERIAATLYNHADFIVTVTPPLKKHLEESWRIPSRRVALVINGVDEKLMKPGAEHSEVTEEFGLDGRFVVSYVGTLGNAHGVETLLECAGLLESAALDVRFLIVGAGAEREKLERLVRERKLNNVQLVEPQPRARVPKILAASQACVVLLKRSELFRTAIPTKMLEMMACGRPVVLSAEGESAALLARAGAGICVAPEDSRGLAEAILLMRSDAALRERCGRNGAAFARRELTRSSTAARYLEILEALTRGEERTEPDEAGIADSSAA
jgi:glycosyltransferase involved in cell wall biosynthesis